MKLFCLALVIFSFSFSVHASFEAVPGQYIIKTFSNLKSLDTKSIEMSLGVEVKERVSEVGSTILIESFNKSLVANLSTHPMVEYIEPNYIYRLNNTLNDPEFSKLWGLKNIGQADPRGQVGLAGYDINAEAAWEITTGSKDIIIWVIDTGVDYEQADLKNNMWINEAEANGVTGVDDDGNGYIDDIYGVNFINNSGDPMDDHDHGTHVAGTIAAEGNNSIDIVGVAWEARIMALKFLSANGGGTLADAIKAIDYATMMGAHLTNNSWGGGGFSQALYEAIQRANDAGIAFVAAAGNSGTNNDTRPSYPATYDIPNVISVAAMDNRGQLANFSCYGKNTVHIAAPGVNILSTTTSGLKSFSGTSMAAPHVAGALALLLSVEPELGPAEIRERLIATARPHAPFKNRLISGGMLDVHSFLTNTPYPPDPNDPANWEKKDYFLSSEHPYPNNANIVYEIRVPGAKRFAVKFSRFDLENNYDFVRFRDADGNSYGSMTGMQDNSFSPVVNGEVMYLILQSDHTINKYGFDIVAIAYEMED